MTTFEQAKRYLMAIPPAVSGQGGHVVTFNAARALKWGFNLTDSEAMTLLQEWNIACQPPWSQAELDHKLHEADTKPFDKPRGYLLNARASRGAWTPSAHPPAPAAAPAELPKLDYDLDQAEEIKLPGAIGDGFDKVLRSCFQPGEGVRLMFALDEETGLIGCNPTGGVVLSREEWLEKNQKYCSGINGLFSRMRGPAPGVYLGVNPMAQDGRGRDADVTAFRHCLLEFDNLSLEEQWLLYTRSNLPCAAVIYSGGRSLHAWVKINAKDRAEYNERVNLVYNHFAAYKPDPHNKNPSRFSRCPDAKRGDAWQLLMALDIGAASFTDWSKHLLVQGIGCTYTENEILNYDADADGMTIVGHHWLRKGGSALLVGLSGTGKSSLARQIAMTWALGRPCFGITPTRELKILMIQAENDRSDLHDMDLGIARGLGILQDPAALERLHKYLITNHNVSHTSFDFIVALQRLIDHHMPDLVIVDPLLSFIGADISKQEIVGQFCRNWLNPILASSNVAFLAVHHSGKPTLDQPSRGGRRKAATMTLAEWSYKGIGSSELTNWARAIMILNPIQNVNVDGGYELLLAKRGKRAQAKHPNGNLTNRILLEHSTQDIFWIQKDPPEEVATATDSPAVSTPAAPILTAAGKVQQVAAANLHEFLSQIPPEGLRMKDLGPQLDTYAANVLGVDLQDTSLRRTIAALVQNRKLAKQGKLYLKGPNA